MGLLPLWRAFSRGGPARSPVPFVVGVPRSGTTLLRLALDAHPELAVPPETGFLLPLLGRLRWRRWTAEAFHRHVTGFHTWPDCGLDAAAFARALGALAPFSVAAGTRRFYELYAAGRGKPRWGDKTPTYGAVTPALRRLLPEARFLHLVRDGRDVALSLGKVWFAAGAGLAERAATWSRGVEAIRRGGHGDPGYLEVRYEDLVSAPRATLERICGFLDLPFSEAMERYPESARERLGELRDLVQPDGRVVTRAERLAQHALTSEPPSSARVGVWRRELSEAEREQFERLAGATLARFGYETSRRRAR